jgi:hypothetical protein
LRGGAQMSINNMIDSTKGDKNPKDLSKGVRQVRMVESVLLRVGVGHGVCCGGLLYMQVAGSNLP